MIISRNGCCKECLEGQQGRLTRPYGQGHSMCCGVPKGIRNGIDRGYAFQSFRSNAWYIVLNDTDAAGNWWQSYQRQSEE